MGDISGEVGGVDFWVVFEWCDRMYVTWEGVEFGGVLVYVVLLEGVWWCITEFVIYNWGKGYVILESSLWIKCVLINLFGDVIRSVWVF